MFKLFEYYGRVEGLRGRLGGLPGWARALIGVTALPGVVLIALSVLALLVSILALLLLTVPLYRLLMAVTGTARRPEAGEGADGGGGGALAGDDGPFASPGRKRVDVTIIE